MCIRDRAAHNDESVLGVVAVRREFRKGYCERCRLAWRSTKQNRGTTIIGPEDPGIVGGCGAWTFTVERKTLGARTASLETRFRENGLKKNGRSLVSSTSTSTGLRH